VAVSKKLDDILEAELNTLTKRYLALNEIRTPFTKACQLLTESIARGGKILLCGNGGSAADCEHIAGELLKGFLSRREVGAEFRDKLVRELGEEEGQHFAKHIQQSIPAISLTSHNGFMTAFGNDVNYEFAFAQHLLGLGKAGDCLIAISTSGNSKNILHATKLAKVLGIQTISLTGSTGGKLRGLSDVCINAPATVVHEIQELHLPIYHSVCLVLEKYFFEA
jgi:D-sedoheptulose 7-phosphate isomerase